MDAAILLDRAIGVHRGYWWRFSRYEIRDGRIVPNPTARLQKYDPAALDVKPHSALFDLAWDLGLLQDRLPKLDDISDARILEWCNLYGLLGLLPGRLLQLTHWPLWERYSLGHDHIVPLISRDIRTPKGWGGTRKFDPYYVSPDSESGQLLSANDLAKWSEFAQIAAPEVILRDETEKAYRCGRPSELGINRYFGISLENADTFQYPMPLSDEFWLAYGEPKGEFLNIVRLMARTLRDAQAHLKPSRSMRVRQERVDEAFDDLNYQLEGVHPFMSPIRDEAKVKDGMTDYSLLQTIARLIQIDLLRGLAPRECPNCKRTFFDGNERKLYHSEQCQKHFKVKAFRAREKEAQTAKRADTPKQSKSTHAKQ
jgi:ribosomal protein L37AE/L43A